MGFTLHPYGAPSPLRTGSSCIVANSSAPSASSPHLAGEAVKTQPHSQPRSPSSRALGSRLHTQVFLLHVEAGRAARNRDGWGNVKEWMSGQLARRMYDGGVDQREKWLAVACAG